MKKNLTKILLVSFALILVFASMGFAVSATEPTVAVASSDFQVRQGETFTTTIYIPDNANIVDFDVTLNYDTDILTLIQAEEHEDVKGTVVFNAEQPGVIAINYTRASKNVTSYLPLINLTFTVDENVGIGTYDCLAVDYEATYIAHTLNDFGTLDPVEFTCNFAPLIIYEMGDVDLNGTLNIADATYIRRHLAEIPGAVLEGFKLSLADTYYDDLVNIADAVSLQRHLAHLNVVYGDRVNVTFVDIDGEIYAKKSVVYDGSLLNIPAVPAMEGYSGGVWSLSANEYVAPTYNNLQTDLTLYAFYEGGKTSEAVEYYKRMLTDQYYSGDMPTNLSSGLNLWSDLYYQNGYHANLIWSSDCNYVLNSTTGEFTKPTYPQDMTLTAKIISYDANNTIEAEDSISFTYVVPGMFVTPTKAEISDWLVNYFTDETDGRYRVNFDVNLISNINHEVIPTNGGRYDDYEVRLNWFQNVNGTLVPISKIERTTSSQINDYVAVATFNGKPLEDDGKIYIDDVVVTAIEEIEIRNHIINEIAANMGTLATNGTKLWNNDTVYGSNVTWETGNPTIAYVANNEVQLKADAVSGSVLPLNARVSYAVDGGAEEFVLSYNLTVSCDNTIIKYPENMDEELYRAIKGELEEEFGYRGDLTSAALASVKFVNLDLSDYPEITSLRGLSYCVNLRTLNISGLKITDGTMNQISTLSYLEAFIARGCELDNLSDGGSPVLKNAINLRLIDLTDNNFTSLDSVFAEGVRYGKLREVYLTNNKLDDIDALSRAPLVDYLSLASNGLTTEDTECLANFPILSYLSLADNNIDSVEHLKGLKLLQELRLHNNNISNVNDLRRLIHLEALYLGNNKIKDIGFLNTLTKVKVLYVNDNEISDISNLTALAELEAININNNKVSSLSVLNNYKSTLTEIYAENNQLTDFSFINGASELHILMLAGNKTDIIQNNMSSWLTGLTKIQVLTLSDIRLNDLVFLSGMNEIVRLDIENCGLSAFTGEVSNIELIANRYATLRILNISNNDMRGYEDEILKLRNISLLTVLYADNICDKLDAYTLTYSMPELKYISLENCGIESAKWLFKYNSLAYVDLANNNISAVSFDSDISNASIKTLQELYLDTNVPCTFTNAYRIADMNVSKLSLAGISVNKMENLPYLDNIRYLNLSNTGLTNLIGDDAELADLFSISRYETVEVIDVSNLETDISLIESLPNVQTVYAVGAVDSKLFYEGNLHTLQRLYNKDVTCYLYDEQTEYAPVATVEGVKILDLLDDISCDVIVAADNVISDNNPFMVDEINDFDITWSVSNSDNYEIVNNHLSVKNYQGLEDETLTITAQITVYPDQQPVTREFTINTSILRASSEYFDINASGYSKQLTRDKVFTYDVKLKAAQTDGFTNPVKPVEDNIIYSYSAVKEDGGSLPYPNVLTVNGNNSFSIASNAPLNATATIAINISHNSKDGTAVNDVETIYVPVTVASRTFAVTVVLNGGMLTDTNNVNHESFECVEDSLIFEGLTVQKTGYLFEGWYLDEALTQLYSIDGTDAKMPSKDITLYAKWKAHSFTLKFNANGGTVSETSRLVLCDTAVGTLPTPQRTGYTFGGWFTSDGKQITASSTMATATDVTVTAKWTVNSYKVSWNTGTGYTIVVKRTASPNAKASTGTLSSGTAVYYGDVLNVSYTASTGYTISSKGSTSITVTSNVTSSNIYATVSVNSYTVSWNTGTGYTITVKRTSSPKAGASIGNLSSGAIVYYGDVLTISYAKHDYYRITSNGATSITVTGNVTSSQIYATAELNPIKGWVKVSELPAGAQVINTKWTYNLREYTTNSASSLSGWTKYDTQRTSWGSWSGWSTTNPTNGTRNVESRTMYHYYRWTNGKGWVYTYKKDSTYYLEEKWFTYILPKSSDGSSIGYVGTDGGANRWARADYEGNRSVDKTFTRTEWRYQEPVYTYYYYRDLSKETTAADPTGQSNVSNVVKWVLYREK